MTPDEVSDAIDAWHKGAGEGLELHEYLGWTWDEYKAWAGGRGPIPDGRDKEPIAFDPEVVDAFLAGANERRLEPSVPDDPDRLRARLAEVRARIAERDKPVA